MEALKKTVLFIALSSLLFTFSVQAICVPRNHDHVAPRSSPVPKVSILPSPSKAPAPKANNPSPKAPSSPPKAPVSAPKAADTNNGELNGLCGLTENPQLCVEITRPYLRGIKDGVSILKAVMNAANDTLTFAISEAEKIASDAKTAPKAKTCINTCLESYMSAVDDIAKSFTAIDEKDIGSLNSNLDSALTMVGTCEDTFNEFPGVESPMQAIDKKLSLMIDNCLAIRNAIKHTFFPPIVVW